VHGAKGLEFPVVVLSGMTTQLAARRRGAQVIFRPDRPWAVHLKQDLETTEFSELLPIEEQMDREERLRLLYVAATRARDHLIVSVHRKASNAKEPTAAELLYRARLQPSVVLDIAPSAHPDDSAERSAPELEAGSEDLPSLEEWRREHDAALASASRPVAVSATRLAEEAAGRARAELLTGMEKDPRDIDLPPWQKGRYGSAIGRAVHGVLQVIDIPAGDGLREACEAQAVAEGVLGKEGVIENLCRSALASPLVQRASTRPYWREVYVGIPFDDGMLEGYVDLLYRDDDGLVIVDYKTDALATEADIPAKVERYRPQLEAYERAAETATGEHVSRSLLLFLAADGPARAVTVTGNG
jgi:ATP-dependent exoDNAse (exonuclease V) beta subunit